MVEHGTRDDPAVGHHHPELGPGRRATSSERVGDLEAQVEGGRASPGSGPGPAPPPPPVGPAHHQRHVVAGVDQRPQRGHGRLGCSQKDQPGHGRDATGRDRGPDQTSRSLPADTSLASMAAVSSPRDRSRRTRRACLRHVLLQPLDHEHAVEVVDLVLEHPTEELVGLDGAPPRRRGRNPRMWTSVGPHDAQPQTGDGEAALVVVPLPGHLDDGRD